MTKLTPALTSAFFAVAAFAAASPAFALPKGAAMLKPGVYTTPDISARCQRYARARTGSSGNTDSERQSVFIACVQTPYRDKYGKAI
jgi:hypothetical protein